MSRTRMREEGEHHTKKGPTKGDPPRHALPAPELVGAVRTPPKQRRQAVKTESTGPTKEDRYTMPCPPPPLSSPTQS